MDNGTALLIIDMQLDFLDPSSPLFVAGGPGIIRIVADTVVAARASGCAIVHVHREHRPDGVDIDQSRSALFARARGFLMAGTQGVQEPPQLQKVSSPCDLFITKRRWSAFFATDLDLLLRRLAIRNLVLAGLQTPNCIRATAYDALSLDYLVTILADATASQTAVIQQSNLADMAALGVTVMDAREWLSSLAP